MEPGSLDVGGEPRAGRYIPVGAKLEAFAKWRGKTMEDYVQEYLTVPFDDKDDAKAKGARFDPVKKLWSPGATSQREGHTTGSP